MNAATGAAIETVGNNTDQNDPILEEVNPDAFLIEILTDSCLCAIAAKERHIYFPYGSWKSLLRSKSTRRNKSKIVTIQLILI